MSPTKPDKPKQKHPFPRSGTDPLPSRRVKLKRPTSSPSELTVDVSNGHYTSLSDVIHSYPVNSPSFRSSDDIQIKHPLLKHAAFAYLQPKASPASVEPDNGCCGFVPCLFYWLFSPKGEVLR